MLAWSFVWIIVGIGGQWKLLATGIPLFITSLIYFWKGWWSVPEEKYMNVEVFKKFWKTFGPGPHWLPPHVAKSRAQPSRRTHRYPIFVETAIIDFKGGGAAIPKKGFVYVEMIPPEEKVVGCLDAPYRMTYFPPSEEEGGLAGGIISLVENATRSYINSLTQREAMPECKAGFDVMSRIRQHPDPLINEFADNVDETLKKWGMRLLPVEITFQDFDLDKLTLEARHKRYAANQARMSAKDVASRRAIEISDTLIGALSRYSGQTKAEVKATIKDDDELQKQCMEFTQDMITRLASIDGNALTDIRVSGGGSALVEAIAAFQKLARA